MIVYCLIKWYKENGIIEEVKVKYWDCLVEIVEYILVMEWWGIDIECDVDLMKKVEFMEDYVGEIFDVVVFFVMKFGFFVVLENMVEGLIYILVMNDDYYEYIEKYMDLVGWDYYYIFQIG